MAKPGGLAIMLDLGKKKPGAGMGPGKDDESTDEDMAEGSESAEDEAFSAFAGSLGSDNKAAKEAFKSFIELCYPELGSGKSDYAEGSGDEEP